MTVTYTSEVTTSSGLGCFVKILRRWKGSIYKIVWCDILLFLGLYYSINLIYRFGLDDTNKKYFEKVVKYCSKYGNLIPLSFVLGFFVNIVMTRWWNQYLSIPSPDNLSILISASIKSDIERARIIRRTIVRYVCLCFAMTLSMISPKVKKRFPTRDHFVQAGLMMKDEKKIFDDLDREYPSYPKYWLPLAWSANIATRARHEGLIREDVAVKTILDEINNFRVKCCVLLDYDWISIPLVYTQVVTLAVYSYFLTTLIGKQFINTHDENDIDLYFPILPILEFFFYMGWLKVAEILINPFGEDDDDFEVVWLIDRHVQVSYLIVDKMHQEHPVLMRDHYWSKIPSQLPFTVASEPFMQEQPQFSTKETNVKPIDANFVDTDGTTPPQRSSLIQRLFGGKRRLISKDSIRMRKMSNKSKNSDTLHEVNESHIPHTVNQLFPQNPSTSREKNNENGDSDDFNRLKDMRQSLIRKRLLQYLELFKKRTNKTDEEIINDLIKQK